MLECWQSIIFEDYEGIITSYPYTCLLNDLWELKGGWGIKPLGHFRSQKRAFSCHNRHFPRLGHKKGHFCSPTDIFPCAGNATGAKCSSDAEFPFLRNATQRKCSPITEISLTGHRITRFCAPCCFVPDAPNCFVGSVRLTCCLLHPPD